MAEKYLDLNGLQYLVRKINTKKADLESPNLQGLPTSTTPAVTDNSTRIATTEYVKNVADKLKLEVGGAAQVIVNITPAVVATVILTNRTNGATYEATTDIAGSAVIQVTQFGTFDITYRSEGAISSVTTITLTTPGQIIYVAATYTTSKTFTAKIDLNNSNPLTSATYLNDAVGMNKGSNAWDNELIFKDIRPCVFKNGSVVYYLSKEDITLKENGTAAKLDGTDGDVMIEFPKFAYKIWKDTTNGKKDLYVSVTNDPQVALENNYKYYAFSKNEYNDRNHFYWGAFKGSLGTNNRLQSIAGVAPASSKTIGAFKECAKANGSGYSITSYFQLVAIQCLYIIKYGNLHAQSALGAGISGRSDTSSAANYGPLVTGGTTTFTAGRKMYYGNPNNSGSSSEYETAKFGHVKFAGIEDFWGNIWEWIDGLTTDASRNIITNWDYDNTAGQENFSVSSGLTADSSGWVTDVAGTTESGFMNIKYGGSSTTYFSGYGGLCASRVLSFGGRWGFGASCGPFYLNAIHTASDTSANVGARLMFI